MRTCIVGNRVAVVYRGLSVGVGESVLDSVSGAYRRVAVGVEGLTADEPCCVVDFIEVGVARGVEYVAVVVATAERGCDIQLHHAVGACVFAIV